MAIASNNEYSELSLVGTRSILATEKSCTGHLLQIVGRLSVKWTICINLNEQTIKYNNTYFQRMDLTWCVGRNSGVE